MAVDLVGFPKIDDHIVIQEAATAGLKSMEHLIRVFSHQSHQESWSDCKQLTDFTVSKFKNVVSVLNRTGHARFRRGPSNPASSHAAAVSFSSSQLEAANPIQPVVNPDPIHILTKPNPNVTESTANKFSKEQFSVSPPMSSANSSFMTSITGDGSVSNGKQGSTILAAPAPAFSAGKPPLASSNRKRCREHGLSDEIAGKHSLSGGCHCSKRRKAIVKRTIRVPAISSKVADIPADEYSWRKYGRKPIKGSPHPRGYYKCSSMKGCPARKHVERAHDDPTMLIVTYEGEHRHSHLPIFPSGATTSHLPLSTVEDRTVSPLK